MAEQDAGGYHEQGLVIGAHLPERVDLRSLLQSVQDQGARSTCLAFTATVAHEVARRANLELLEDLSEEVLYWGCKQVDGVNEPGTVFSSAASALRQWGQPAEDIWPYDGNRDDTDTSYIPPPGALDPAICYSANMSRIGTSIDDIRYCLANGRAVALGIRLSHGFYEPVDGLIPLPSSEKELTEGHAVLV